MTPRYWKSDQPLAWRIAGCDTSTFFIIHNPRDTPLDIDRYEFIRGLRHGRSITGTSPFMVRVAGVVQLPDSDLEKRSSRVPHSARDFLLIVTARVVLILPHTLRSRQYSHPCSIYLQLPYKARNAPEALKAANSLGRRGHRDET